MKSHVKSAALLGALLLGMSSAASVEGFSIDGIDYAMPFFLAQALGGTSKEVGNKITITFGKISVQMSINSQKVKVNNSSATFNNPVVATKEINLIPVKDFIRVTNYKSNILVKNKTTLYKEQLVSFSSPATAVTAFPVAPATDTASVTNPPDPTYVTPHKGVAEIASDAEGKIPTWVVSPEFATGKAAPLLEFADREWRIKGNIDPESAVDTCISLVSLDLKSPSTAKYKNGATVVPEPDGVWTVDGAVDSQNSYGATVRGDYFCVIQRSTGDLVKVYVRITTRD